MHRSPSWQGTIASASSLRMDPNDVRDTHGHPKHSAFVWQDTSHDPLLQSPVAQSESSRQPGTQWLTEGSPRDNKAASGGPRRARRRMFWHDVCGGQSAFVMQPGHTCRSTSKLLRWDNPGLCGNRGRTGTWRHIRIRDHTRGQKDTWAVTHVSCRVESSHARRTTLRFEFLRPALREAAVLVILGVGVAQPERRDGIEAGRGFAWRSTKMPRAALVVTDRRRYGTLPLDRRGVVRGPL